MVIHKGCSVIPSRSVSVEAMNCIDIFTDGDGWHSEYLAFGSDERSAKAAVKFGTTRDLLRVNNLLLFLCYEVDNLEFMACLEISCLEGGKWISLLLWHSVFLHYIWSVLWHLVSDSASAWHSSSQIHTIGQTDVSGALSRSAGGKENNERRKNLICGRNLLILIVLHFGRSKISKSYMISV